MSEPSWVSEMEDWTVVPDGLAYEVSSFGRVRSTRLGRSKMLKIHETREGRFWIALGLGKRGRRKYWGLPRLILQSFEPLPPEEFAELEACHLNDRRDDNRLANLAWGTHEQNLDHTAKSRWDADRDD